MIQDSMTTEGTSNHDNDGDHKNTIDPYGSITTIATTASVSSTTKIATESVTNHNNQKSNTRARPHNNNNNNKNEWDEIGLSEEEMLIRDAVVPYLIERSCHLPGYNYQQDLYQYYTNNHPIFGICCHHKYHPVGMYQRIILLVGSLLFGLTLTNIIYLIFYYTNTDYSKTYYETVPNNSINNSTLSKLEQALGSNMDVTTANIVLWTVGSFIHGVYEEMLWHLSICSCYYMKNYDDDPDNDNTEKQQRRYKIAGAMLLTLIVVFVLAITTFIFVIVNMVSNNESIDSTLLYKNTTYTTMETVVTGWTYTNASFFTSYAVELLLSYFIYYPIIGYISFSGILSCYGKFPLCGGRPYEIQKERQQEQQRNHRNGSIDAKQQHDNVSVDDIDEEDEEETQQRRNDEEDNNDFVNGPEPKIMIN